MRESLISYVDCVTTGFGRETDFLPGACLEENRACVVAISHSSGKPVHAVKTSFQSVHHAPLARGMHWRLPLRLASI
jgi:hypothetical protein